MVDSIVCASAVRFPRSRSTGKERDAESGNDYFGARYYASPMGRWLSPDWSAKEEPVPYAKLDDPQSLNLYTYVRNNPLTRADADGHVAPGGTGGCTGSKCTNGKSDGSTGKQIQQTIKDHPIAAAVVAAVAQTALAVATGGGSVAAEVAADVVVEAGAEATLETSSVELTATVGEESASSSGISMDTAVDKAASHVDGGVMETTGKGTNFQFRNTTTGSDGTVTTKIGRFDVNPADSHVQANGPHLNLETQVNGVKTANEHIPIDGSTVRPGDHP